MEKRWERERDGKPGDCDIDDKCFKKEGEVNFVECCLEINKMSIRNKQVRIIGNIIFLVV